MRFDPCEYCGGGVRLRRVTVDLRCAERLTVFRNVPVGVCGKCGERFYPGPVLEQLHEIARHALRPNKTIRVATLDFSAVG